MKILMAPSLKKVRNLDRDSIYIDLIRKKEQSILALKSKATLGLTASEVRRFLEIQFLSNLESKLERKHGDCPVPFIYTLASLSPTYRRYYEVAHLLKIEMTPKIRTRFQLLEEFDPFAKSMSYADIKTNLKWFNNRSVDALHYKDLVIVLHFNIATHHDLLHSVFSELIPPNKSRPDLDYFLFIESLVFIQEFYISREFGPFWSALFSAINCSYRSYDLNDPQFQRPPRELFLGLFLTHLGSLRGWNKSKMKKKFPEIGPYISEKHMGFDPIFSQRITNDWYNFYKKNSRPYKKRKLSSKVEQLKIENFSLDFLIKNPKSLEKLYSWFDSIFSIHQPLQ